MYFRTIIAFILLQGTICAQAVVNAHVMTPDSAVVSNAKIIHNGHEYVTDAEGNVTIYEVPNPVDPVNPIVPDNPTLYPAVPNPFKEGTNIGYSLPNESDISVTVYDIGGREVKTLYKGAQNRGPHSLSWNGLDNQGNNMENGLYLYSIEVNGQKFTQKMLKMDKGSESFGGSYPFSKMDANNYNTDKGDKNLGKVAGEYNIFDLYNEAGTNPQVKDSTYTNVWVEGDTVNVDFIMQRQGQAPSVSEVVDQVLNEDEMPDNPLFRMQVSDDYTPNDQLNIQIANNNPDLIGLSISDSLDVIVDYLGQNQSGMANIDVNVTDLDGNTTTRSFDITVNEIRDIAGYIQEIENGNNVPGYVEINGTVFETDSTGYFSLQFQPTGNDTLRAQSVQDTLATSYVRTIRIENDNLETLMKVVPFLDDSTGVSREVFKAFCREANLGPPGFPMSGLKKIDFDNAEDYTYWIASYNPFNGDTFSQEEQESIRDSLQTRVLGSIPEENRPNIYLGTAEDEIPLQQYGKMIILPERGHNASIGTADDNNDGYLDRAVIFLPDAYGQRNLVQEAVSALYAPNEVFGNSGILPSQTVLHWSSSETEKKRADKMLECKSSK